MRRMSKTALTAIGLILLLLGFGLGYSLGLEANSPKAPPAPRTREEVARAVETMGDLRGILAERNVMKRAERLAARLGEMGTDDVLAVSKLLHAGAVGLGSAEASLLTRFWGMYDPKAAAEWSVMRSAPIGVRPIVAESAIEAWASSDPVAAREFMEKVAARMQGSAADGVQSAYVRGWFASGVPGLEEFIHSQGEETAALRNLTTLIQERLHRDGFEATLDWLDEFPGDPKRFKRSLFRQAAPELFKYDRDGALAWCEKTCDGPFGEHTRAIIARQWAREDGQTAMMWVASAPPSEERDRAVWSVYQEWRQSDSDDLDAWLDAMGPDGIPPWFYPAADRVAMAKAWDYPLEAYRWAAKIPQDDRREMALITITRRYREVDPAGADAWLAESPLSEEAREQARTFPEGWRGRGKRPYPGRPAAK
jgi:hypothetical protein